MKGVAEEGRTGHVNLCLKWTPSPKVAAARKGENEHTLSTYSMGLSHKWPH